MAWLAFVHFVRSLLRIAWGCAVALALFPLSGCAAGVVTHFGPTLDSPHVTHVCVKQPKMPENQRFWGVTDSGKLIVEDWELALYQEHARSIYYFDPEAPPESAGRLPIPYHTLKCPERILSKAPVLPRKPAAVAKKPAEEKKNETKEPEAQTAKAEAKPPPPQPSATPPRRTEEHRAQRQVPRVASKGCEAFSEPGQTRSRGGKTRTCVRTRLLIHRGPEEDPPPQALAAVKPPEPEPVPPKPVEYADWGLSEPDSSGLDPDRVKECLGGVCHARHKNFKPKGKKPGEAGYGKAGAGEGGAPPTKTRTTVKTRKSPLSRPKEPRLKKDGTPRAKPGPKTEDTEPHNAKVIEKRKQLEAEGNTIVKGGRKPGLTEEVVKTPGGHKETRRPDITYETPDGKKRGINVGKTNADGTPVDREQKALDDLNNHSDRPTDFVPYDR